MELDQILRQVVKTEVTFISGVLRVSIEHELNSLRLLLDGLIFAWIAWAEIGAWQSSHLWSRAVALFALAAAAADLAYQMTGSETVEFSMEGLRTRRQYFGWERVRLYPLEKCSELSWRPENDREHDLALECKVGWHKVRFGKYLSATQAWEVLSELQRCLPDVAHRIGMSLVEQKSRITQLGLG